MDGIYPEIARFLKAISLPTYLQENVFTGWQEAARKDIECAWGIFQSKFRMCLHPCESHSKEDIQACVLSCIMFHNMMVEYRVNSGEEENIGFYDVVQDTAEVLAGSPVSPSVTAATQEEENIQKALAEVEGGTRTMDSKLREKKRMLSVLDFKTRVAQKRWEALVNKNEHQRLKNAVVRHLHKSR